MEDMSIREAANNPYLPKVHFEAIPIKELISDQEYQRTLSVNHVKRASEHFDPYQINPVKVSRRNGINYVFNGQHTMEIVATVSGTRDTPVWCMVYEDLEYEREADIFANQQKYVKALTPYEIFLANIEAGNDKQLLIKELVESYGLRIAPISSQNGICAVAALENIYERYGYEILSRALRLLVGTWEGNQQSLGASMMKGLARLLAIYDTEMKDDLFIAKLGVISVKEVIRSAKERHGGAMGFAEAMLVYYNKKLSKPLAQEKLYMHNHKKLLQTQVPTIPENELSADKNPNMSKQNTYEEGASNFESYL